ncbi:MAG: carbohydrate ABC transporter permease [Spirochaetia bacterium]
MRAAPRRRYLLFIVPAGLYLLGLALYPFVNLIWMSLSDVTTLNIVRGSWPFRGLANFLALGRLPDFALAFRNTLVFVAIVVSVGMLGGLGAATLLQGRGKFSAVGLGLMVFTWAMPPVVLGSLWKFLLLPGGLVNSILGSLHISKGPLWLVQQNLVLVTVALVNSWAVIPFSALVYRAALVDIPVELLDASSVDGASAAQRFFRIKMPLLLPITLILTVLTVVYAFRSFDFIYVMTYGGPGVASTTLPFLSYRLSFINYKYALGAGVAVFTVVIVFVLAFVYVRALRRTEEK